MKLTEKKMSEFKKVIGQVMKFMNDNPKLFNPHHKIIIDTNHVEVVSGELGYTDNQFLHD